MISLMPSQSQFVPRPPLIPSTTICCSTRTYAYVPILELFSQSKLNRFVKDPPLIHKSENDLSDTLLTLLVITLFIFIVFCPCYKSQNGLNLCCCRALHWGKDAGVRGRGKDRCMGDQDEGKKVKR